MTTRVLIFTEGDFDGVTDLSTYAEAKAYAAGLRRGAGLYSGNLAAYVMPEEEDCLREEQRADQVVRAIGESGP